MRIGVVVDSSCDLPPEFMEEHGVKIFPNSIRIGQDTLVDERDPDATLAFFSSHIGDKSHDAETSPFSVDAIQKVFLERLVLDYDFVFCITVWSKRSHVYENATKASFAILSTYRKTRSAAGVTGPFSMRVIDSKTLFCGVGLVAAETVRMAQEGLQPNEIRANLDQLIPNVVGYFVPADLAYIRIRALSRGEKSVGLATYLIGTALDIKPVLGIYREDTKPVAKVRGYDGAVEKMLLHIAKSVKTANLLSKYVVVSYGGDLDEVRNMAGYAELERACQERELTLMLSIMSATAVVNVGAGGICAGYAGDLVPM
ncbi:MAG: DegV family protein [Nevskiales bacterium]